MLKPGRIPLSEAEGEAIDKLLVKHGGSATLTRRDPGDSGPVLVHLDAGTWEIDPTGKAKKHPKARAKS